MQPTFEIEINKYINHWHSSGCFEKPVLRLILLARNNDKIIG